MIKSLKISNFQSHKNSKMTFDKGVNAIVGLSDSGKSAVLRALAWLITNKVDDSSFQSTWGGVTKVTAEFEDATVTRERNKKDNIYHVDNSTYKAFKTEVPDEVKETIDIDALNIQTQMESPFLLSKNGSDVAKTLNRIANLSNIDDSISKIRGLIYANSREITSCKDIIKEQEEQLSKYDFIEDMESKVSKLELLVKRKGVKVITITTIERILYDIEQYEKIVQQKESVLKAAKPLQAALVLVEDFKAKETKIYALERLLLQLAKAQSQLESTNILKAEPKLIQLNKTIIQWGGIPYDDLKNLVEAIKKKIEYVECKKADVIRLQLNYSDIMPNECPLCGRECEIVQNF